MTSIIAPARFPAAVLFLVAVLPLTGWSQEPERCTEVADLDWMLGSWTQETQGTIFFEQWRRHDDGSLRGFAESHKDDGTELFQQETMIIRLDEKGLVYSADPGNSGEFVDFAMVSCEASSVVFENPEHDFPKRLAYRLNEDGELHASVTDLEDQGFDLVFTASDG